MAVRQKRRTAKDAVDKLFDSFKTKDMTRAEFRAAYLHLTDPRRLRRDLAGIVQRRQTEQTQTLQIERGLQGGRICK